VFNEKSEEDEVVEEHFMDDIDNTKGCRGRECY